MNIRTSLNGSRGPRGFLALATGWGMQAEAFSAWEQVAILRARRRLKRALRLREKCSCG